MTSCKICPALPGATYPRAVTPLGCSQLRPEFGLDESAPNAIGSGWAFRAGFTHRLQCHQTFAGLHDVRGEPLRVVISDTASAPVSQNPLDGRSAGR